MASTIITFSKADVHPPVYIAGAFTAWSPVEMAHELTESGQTRFTHTAELQPGKYQYKFRLGPGDWWVLDDSAPTEEDGSGNTNNVLAVEAEESKASPPNLHETDAQASIPTAPSDTVAVMEDELRVTANTTAEDVEVHKEASIPDVAPPPYSVEEHATSHAVDPPKLSSVPKIVGIKKSSESKSKAQPEKGGLAKKVMLVAAIVAVPVAVSFFLRR